MLMPDVKNEFPMPVNGIRFVVTAYRKLNDQEMLESIALYFRSTKKPAKKGSVVTIISIIQ